MKFKGTIGKRTAVVGGTVLAATASATLFATASAQATPSQDVRPLGTSCDGGCSSSYNDSNYGATALRNWCGGGTTGTLTTKDLTNCKSGSVKQSWKYLAPGGGHTTLSEDWDVLQIDAGWCYKVKFILPFQPDNTTIYDRRHKSNAWVKIENFSDTHLQAQSSTSFSLRPRSQNHALSWRRRTAPGQRRAVDVSECSPPGFR